MLFVCLSVSAFYIVGIFLEDGQVCEYSNFETNGKIYESGDVVELPRRDKQECAVVILGIHENLCQAAAAAKTYFDRICKWNNVTERSCLNLFGNHLSAIEQEVSQIALFETQGIEGPLLRTTNCFDLNGLYNDHDTSTQSQDQD